MSDKQKYPKVVVGAFVFNEKDELFLMKTKQWKNLYTVPGGGVELNETMVEAAKREVKEETNIDIKNMELIPVSEGLNLTNDIYSKPEDHLIFINFKAEVKEVKNIKLNKEGTGYKWLKPKEWLKRKDINKSARELIENYLLDEETYEHRYKRALADYQNLLKRTAEEKQEFVKYANEQLVLEIIPVYDNLKISLEHACSETKKNGWLEGVEHVVKQFESVLKNLGVEEIETKGKKFDHHTMDAIEGKGKKVKKEVRPGYKLNGKVIVPAKVVVG